MGVAPRQRRPWLPREDRTLRASAGIVPVATVAARLGRSRPAVLARAPVERSRGAPGSAARSAPRAAPALARRRGRPGGFPARVPPGLRARSYPRPGLARLRRRAPTRARSLADAMRSRAAHRLHGARCSQTHRLRAARRPPLGRALLPATGRPTLTHPAARDDVAPRDARSDLVFPCRPLPPTAHSGA